MKLGCESSASRCFCRRPSADPTVTWTFVLRSVAWVLVSSQGRDVDVERVVAGALNAYQEGIRQLNTMYKEWGCLTRADTAMRASQWTVILEEMRLKTPAGFDDQKPWDAVIHASAFGASAGMREHWWWQRVTGPLSTGASAARAHATVDELEGRPRSYFGESKGKGKDGAGGKGAPRGAPKRGEICHAWNSGNCVDGKCPAQRIHKCSICGKNHRSIDCGPGQDKDGKRRRNDRKEKDGKGLGRAASKVMAHK